MSKRSVFGQSKAIERKIDEFMDKVSETALVFVAMLKHSLESESAELDETGHRRVEQMLELKRACSGLRREIEAELYVEMLVPDLLPISSEPTGWRWTSPWAVRSGTWSRRHTPSFAASPTSGSTSTRWLLRIRERRGPGQAPRADLRRRSRSRRAGPHGRPIGTSPGRRSQAARIATTSWVRRSCGRRGSHLSGRWRSRPSWIACPSWRQP